MQERETQPADTRRVTLFGVLRVTDSRGVLMLPGGKLQSLFTFLCLNPTLPTSREHLAELLWPDASPYRARRSVADALYRLRQILGDTWLVLEGDWVALATNVGLSVDVWDFTRLIQSHEVHDLVCAVELYTGDLVPACYDDWILVQRETLRERYLVALERLATAAEARDDTDTALIYYQRLVAADPLREAAQRGLMRTLATADRLADALAVYDRLMQILETELRISPTPATTQLAENLRRERDLHQQQAAQTTAAYLHPTFVGRFEERMRLLTCLQQKRVVGSRPSDSATARPDPGALPTADGLIVLLGEAGVGKTRLLEEVANAAAWRGWQVVWGRGQEFDLPLPYAPLRQALATLPRPRIQQLARLVAPAQLQQVACLVPHLLEEPEPQHHTEHALAGHSTSQLPVALTAVLEGLHQIAPHLLILDDVQWADPAFWSLLDALRAPLAALQVVLVVCGRSEELRTQLDAWTTLERWDHAGTPVIGLGGLEAADLHALYLATTQIEPSPEQLARLCQASGGNPLLALALLQLGEQDSLSQHPSLTEVALCRVVGVSDMARRVLESATVLSYQFDYAVWEALITTAGWPVTQLPALAGELERAGLLRLRDTGYCFAHDTLRAAVYGQMPAPQRRLWHQHAFTVLQQRVPHEPIPLLYHAQCAALYEHVATYALLSGQQALTSFSVQAAVQYFRQALDALPQHDLEQRHAAVRGLARSFEVLANRDAQRDAVDMLCQMADQLNQPHLQAEAAWHAAVLEWNIGAYQVAQTRASAALPLALAAGDLPRYALLLEINGRAVRDLGQYDAAKQLFRQAHDVYTELRDESAVAWIDGMLGIVAQRQGNIPEAIACHRRALEAHCANGNLFNEMRAASGLAVALWMSGEYLQARTLFERTLLLSRRTQDRRIEEASLANLGALADILGDYHTAARLKQEGLALSRATGNLMGIAIGLCNLGFTYYYTGEFELALSAFDEALAIDRATGRRQGEGYVLHGRGKTLLELGRIAEAYSTLTAARILRQELAERDVLIATEADLALTALAANQLDAASTFLESALALLRADDRADLRAEVHYAAYCVSLAHNTPDSAITHLRHAAAAMRDASAILPAEARKCLQYQNPVHRRITRALNTHAQQIHRRVARADAPLGRPLSAAAYVMVTWTVCTPEDDTFGDPGARRQHILRRLIEEAITQHAAPTDDDLAQVLGVSRRTVLRDRQHLAATGVALPTRRRVRKREA